LNYGNYNSW